MRRKIFSIWSVLLILVLALAVFVPGCEGEGETTGTIEVKATLDGSPWPSSGTGAVEYTLTLAGGSPTNGSEVPKTFADMDTGDWTCAYVSGGPGTFVSITTAETQNLAAGETITFTLNFVTPATPIDAEVYFKSWTHNGVPIPPEQTWVIVYPGDWIDVEYTEHVSGNPDAHVTVHQTSWLSVHNIGWWGEEPGGPTVNLHVVNAPGAVKMDPPAADKSNQRATVEGNPVEACALVPLPFCEPVKLDVEVDWELVVCKNYTKTINWIGFNPPPDGDSMPLFDGPDVLFESTDDFYNAVTFNLTAKACVEPGEGFEDTDPANDCTDWAPTLTVTYLVAPPL
jgi:hypothetical protein